MSIDLTSTIAIVAGVVTLFFASLVLTLLRMRQKLAEAKAQLAVTQDEITSLQHASYSDNRAFQTQLNEKSVAIARLQTLVEQKEHTISEKQSALDTLLETKERYIQLQTRFKEREEQLKQQESMVNEAKNTLLKEFELSANKLFEAKHHSFQSASRQNIENVLSPFRQQLSDFHKQVEDVYFKENAQRNQLIGQIGELQKQASKMSDDANNLAQALKGDNKVQGQWGEFVLERLLEQSGLEKGREYITQSTFKSTDGKSYRPDVIVRLPENKDIVIDAKVALTDYERFATEVDDAKRELYQKSHVDTIRAHIKGLSTKAYEQLDGIRTLDFVFMFVPIEAAYIAAIHHTPSLFKEAHEKNIMLVSPSSLMVALRTVETMWRYEKQNANAEKIANSAGKIYDQFVLVLNALEELGAYINKAGESHELVLNRLSRGRGNVIKKIDDLKKLGAKTTKSPPKQLLERMNIIDDKQIELLDEEDHGE